MPEQVKITIGNATLRAELFDTACAKAIAARLPIEAEEMFTKLMGEEVESRRQFIEDNALNVRELAYLGSGVMECWS